MSVRAAGKRVEGGARGWRPTEHSRPLGRLGGCCHDAGLDAGGALSKVAHRLTVASFLVGDFLVDLFLRHSSHGELPLRLARLLGWSERGATSPHCRLGVGDVAREGPYDAVTLVV